MEWKENTLYLLFEACLQQTYITVENGASFSVVRRGNAAILFFEHSNGREDWRNNLRFPAIPYRRMKPIWRCHSGFLRVWKSAEMALLSVLSDRGITSYTAVGYSHGAALAVLCHEYLWFHRPDVRKNLFGVGFGCPRVFHGNLTPELAVRWENFTVVRNRGDLVTHLPPVWLGYRHVGQMLEIGSNTRYSPINAHRPENYKAELQSPRTDT